MNFLSHSSKKNFNTINLSLLKYSKIFQTIYLDQNILTLVAKHSHLIERGQFAGLDYQFIFSNETLNEIKRSNQPEKYLDILNLINARHLVVDTDEKFTFIDSACIKVFMPLEEVYNEFAFSDVIDDYAEKFLDSNNDFLLLNLADNDRESSLEEIHLNQKKNYSGLLDEMHTNCELLLSSDEIPIEFKEYIEWFTTNSRNSMEEPFYDALGSIEKTLTEQGYDISGNEGFSGIRETESRLGFGAKELNNIKSPNVINKIYKLYCSKSLDECKVPITEFINFFQKPKVENDILNNQILQLYIFLNIIGYQRDKNFHKQKRRLVSMLSDAKHAMYGSYADYIASDDEAFLLKCQAIYEYLNVKARIMRIKVE